MKPSLWVATAAAITALSWAGATLGAGESRPTASASVSLAEAYKREFAFLQAEKASLAQRLEQQRAAGAQKVASAEAELAALQGSVLAASMEGDRLAGMLMDAAEGADKAAEGPEVLETLLAQASASLDKGGVKLPEADGEEARAEQLKAAFQGGLLLLERYASVREVEGTFFAPDGKQVQGRLLEVGNIATYGVGDGAAGALAPAGQERRKVWTENPSSQTASALVEGQRPETIGIFLYESLDKSVESKKAQTTVEHVASGGIIAWVIVGLGALGVLMVMARAVLLGRSGVGIDQVVARLEPLVGRGDLAAADRLCEAMRGAAARVLRVTVRNVRGPRERLEDVVGEALLHEQSRLDRFGTMILVVAAVAPLLGLLGTVTGMISTFDVITEFGTGDPKMLSGGISEALVTTELGLIVAIPMLLVGNVLSSWASGIKDALDKAALRISNVGAGVQVESVEETKPLEAAEELAPVAT